MILFKGTAPAMVTPFAPDNTLDEDALRRVIDFQIEGGVDALVVLGTTGENPTVTDAERRRLTELTIEYTDRRVPVIVGTGTNNTAQSVIYSNHATQAGADGLLVVVPYYNKPTPEGFFQHTAAIAEAVDTPLVLYNVPGRTGTNLSAETTLRIAEDIPSAVAVKEASGDFAQIMEILKHRPADFAVYSGDDAFTLPMMALGADGVVSVIANALPRPFARMIRLTLSGQWDEARDLHFELLDAMHACFYESNPGPIKAVMAEQGLLDDRMRLPLAPLTEANRTRVLDAFQPFLQNRDA